MSNIRQYYLIWFSLLATGCAVFHGLTPEGRLEKATAELEASHIVDAAPLQDLEQDPNGRLLVRAKNWRASLDSDLRDVANRDDYVRRLDAVSRRLVLEWETVLEKYRPSLAFSLLLENFHDDLSPEIVARFRRVSALRVTKDQQDFEANHTYRRPDKDGNCVYAYGPFGPEGTRNDTLTYAFQDVRRVVYFRCYAKKMGFYQREGQAVLFFQAQGSKNEWSAPIADWKDIPHEWETTTNYFDGQFKLSDVYERFRDKRMFMLTTLRSRWTEEQATDDGRIVDVYQYQDAQSQPSGFLWEPALPDEGPAIVNNGPEESAAAAPRVAASATPAGSTSASASADVPVTVEFVALADGGAQMRLRNHSDKAVREVKLLLHYQNAKGKDLKKVPWTQQSDDTLVEPNDQVEKNMGFSIPKATTNVVAAVLSVEFTDGSHWKPAKKHR